MMRAMLTPTQELAPPRGLETVSVASWLLVVERPRQCELRKALAGLQGVEYRTTVGDHLVVVSESAPEQVEGVHARLRSLGDVKDVALVSVFEDRAEVQ